MAQAKDNKFSVYLKDESLKSDIKLLAQYDGKNLTTIITTALTAYLATRQEDLEFERKQYREREERKESLQAKTTE